MTCFNRNISMKTWSIALVLTMLTLFEGGFPTWANATVSDTITSQSLGKSFTIDWLVPTSTTGFLSNLTTSGTFTVSKFTSSKIVLGVSLDNTTPTSIQTAILSLGIDASSHVSSSVANSSIFDYTSDPGKFPGGFKNINVCVYAGNNCNGGPINNGLMSGVSTNFDLTLTGTALTSVNLSQFAIKYQTQNGSFELGGTNAPLSSNPEPSSLVLFGSALLGLLFFGSRSPGKLLARD
ncbi:MAG: cistern family PEP-CTERM protein [Leptospirales bacterium]